jgi:hypothetical protein
MSDPRSVRKEVIIAAFLLEKAGDQKIQAHKTISPKNGRLSGGSGTVKVSLQPHPANKGAVCPQIWTNNHFQDLRKQENVPED